LAKVLQLIDARTDTHMWAASYERPWADILSLQKEIAGDVSEQVQVRLTAVERRRLASRRPVVPAAFQASLDGMFRMQDLWSRESFQRAVDTFKAAVARDPGFAPAWVGLANCYWGANQFGVIPTKEAMPGTREAANRAVSLDGSSAAAHTVLAFVHYLYDRDPAASEREFRTALRLAPSSAEAHRWYGSLLSSLGRHAEAIAEVEKARDIDPRDLINRLNVAARLYYARHYDAAIDEAMVAEGMAPGFYMPLMVEGWAYAGKKDYTKAITALTQSSVLAGDTGMEPLAFLGYVLGTIGRTEEARAAVAKLDGIAAKGVEIAPFFRAEPLLGIGETERALDWIEKACDEGDLNLVWNFQDPVLDNLRSHPRFISVKKKLGL
jgi:tetratricopeptide (TPR) repeat protein